MNIQKIDRQIDIQLNNHINEENKIERYIIRQINNKIDIQKIRQKDR